MTPPVLTSARLRELLEKRDAVLAARKRYKSDTGLLAFTAMDGAEISLCDEIDADTALSLLSLVERQQEALERLRAEHAEARCEGLRSAKENISANARIRTDELVAALAEAESDKAALEAKLREAEEKINAFAIRAFHHDEVMHDEMAARQQAEGRVKVLEEALAFYRDGWAFKADKRRAGLTWHPKETLLDDCGNIAKAALSPSSVEG